MARITASAVAIWLLMGIVGLAQISAFADGRQEIRPVEASPFGALLIRDAEQNRLAVHWSGEPGSRLSLWLEKDGSGDWLQLVRGVALSRTFELLPVADLASFGSRPEVRAKVSLQDPNGGERTWIQDIEVIGAHRSPTPSKGVSTSPQRCEWSSGYHLRGLDGTPLAMISFDDGSGPALYVGGNLSSADAQVDTSIARWDGIGWQAIGTGPNRIVYSFAIFDHGGGPALFAAGANVADGDQPANVARWTGTEWVPLASDVDGTVYALEVFDDGGGPALYAAGIFNEAGGQEAKRIAKWDGVSWSPLGLGTNSQIYSLAVFDDGGGPALFAGGDFTQAGGSAANFFAKWDGSTWSAPTQALDHVVRALEVFADAGGPALYAAGDFELPGSPYIGRWNGSSWSAVGGGLSNRARSLHVFDDGGGEALYVGGSFVDSSGVGANGIAKWDGSAWSNLGAGTNSTVYAMADFDDGGGAALFAGGSFSVAGTVAASGVARWQASQWSRVSGDDQGLGIGSWPRALAVFDDGGGSKLYAAGELFNAGGVSAQRIAAFDGSAWTALGSGIVGSDVNALGVFDDGGGPELYVGGLFDTAGGIAVSNIAKWDGAAWAPVGSGLDGVVNALTVFDDGTGPALYAGGNFTNAGGVHTPRIAKWDGASWSTLGVGVNSQVYALAVFDDGMGAALYAGGAFVSAGGAPALHIAKWDGTGWSSLPGELLNFSIFAMAVHDDGTGPAIYAGGDEFQDHDVAKWDGSVWAALPDTDIGTITAMAAFDDGTGEALYVGGRGIRKWDGAWSQLNGRLTGTVLNPSHRVDALLPFDDGGGETLFAGGQFRRAGMKASHHIAEYDCIPTPSLDLRNDLPVAAGAMVAAPLDLKTDGATLTRLDFSIDFDESCLSFDPADGNGDGVPDAFIYSGPAEYQLTATFDGADTDGELDVSLERAAPMEPLSDGLLATLWLTATCSPPASSPALAVVGFSTDPAPVFGESPLTDLNGSTDDGSVIVYSGLRGDCDGDQSLTATDLEIGDLEIFDGDGSFWGQTPLGSVDGSPVGCDANADTVVDAGDLSCHHRLVSSLSCGNPRSGSPSSAVATGAEPPVLEIGPWEPPVSNGRIELELKLSSGGSLLNSSAVSLKLVEDGFTFDTTDSDLDGIPDALSFPGVVPSYVASRWDPNHEGGRLDLTLSEAGVDASAAFPDPFVVRIELQLTAPAPGTVFQPFRFASEPAASVGDVQGTAVPLQTSVAGIELFSDDFESGGLGAWGAVVP